jgi:hypothetical protein
MNQDSKKQFPQCSQVSPTPCFTTHCVTKKKRSPLKFNGKRFLYLRAVNITVSDLICRWSLVWERKKTQPATEHQADFYLLQIIHPHLSIEAVFHLLPPSLRGSCAAFSRPAYFDRSPSHFVLSWFCASCELLCVLFNWLLHAFMCKTIRKWSLVETCYYLGIRILLDSDRFWSSMWLPTFWRNVLSSSSTRLHGAANHTWSWRQRQHFSSVRR